MSKLHVNARQWITFNAQDAQHRAWYAEYIRTRTWGKCPVRFEVDGEPGHIGAIERLILEYYTKKEFPQRKKRLTPKPKGVIIDTSTTH
jgi:hypothetical protein